MIEINKLAEGVAADLLKTSAGKVELETLIIEAFSRGLTLGMTVRRLDTFPASQDPSQPLQKDSPPWTPMH
jgi:hypothetical protein